MIQIIFNAAAVNKSIFSVFKDKRKTKKNTHRALRQSKRKLQRTAAQEKNNSRSEDIWTKTKKDVRGSQTRNFSNSFLAFFPLFQDQRRARSCQNS